MKLKILEMTFESTQEFTEDVSCIRGFFATKFNDLILLHNHNTDKFVYKYPLVQYKSIEGKPLLIGINEGTEALKEIFDKFDKITLNHKDFEIIERTMKIKQQDFGLTKEFYYYKFVTPWLALSQKNNEKYQLTQNNEEKAILLRKILTGNLLSMSKIFEYEVPGEIKCDVDLAPGKSRCKDNNFTSFCGDFIVNFYIPDYLGIGKSVSKGYGTVRKIPY